MIPPNVGVPTAAPCRHCTARRHAARCRHHATRRRHHAVAAEQEKLIVE